MNQPAANLRPRNSRARAGRLSRSFGSRRGRNCTLRRRYSATEASRCRRNSKSRNSGPEVFFDSVEVSFGGDEVRWRKVFGDAAFRSRSRGVRQRGGRGEGVGKTLSGLIKVGLIATFAGPQQIGRCASKVTDLRNGPQGLFLCKDRPRQTLG